ncbi:nucleoside triphosphate pyrophosphohydrolase [Mucispirillum schaedleri]|uniref:nucleoside triphosphate pyrophosphohydrolase n=1 Tax=Mucispirillum schaedleri TaxID=248039 RepID=UPI001F59C44D|nr:nucleoside triphosphate pyrophosphohydrolase [Mucispirillum schaedleri]
MSEFDKLIDIVKKLRAPDGCPWDRKQTLYSLKDALIEETCELIDALDNKDIENIKEELGDVLLHVVFHSQTACEDGLFNIEDVICGINEKLIRRHPHVFKNEHYETAEQVKERWDEIKKEENKDKTAPDSILDKVPKSLPSLMQAEKLQKKASKYGFDWENPEQVFKKLQEELNELHDAYKEKNKEHISEELGDVIFVLSRLATHLDISADESLRKVNNKFRRRFGFIEKSLKETGRTLETTTVAEMEEKWQEAKRKGL